MVESNSFSDFVRTTLQDPLKRHQNSVRSRIIIAMCDDDNDKLSEFEKRFVESGLSNVQRYAMFRSVEQCIDFIYEAYVEKQISIIVYVPDRLANELIPQIHGSEEISFIFIIDTSPPSEEKRNCMQQYHKV
jgi:hypothetical protein